MQTIQTTTTATPPAEVLFSIGDPATHTGHTDSKAVDVIDVSPNGKTIKVRYCKQELLNGANSGEPDALVCTAGGFCGHTEGRQRWSVEADPDGCIDKFTLRRRGSKWVWKLAGAGTNQPGNTLNRGHHPHYDFNF